MNEIQAKIRDLVVNPALEERQHGVKGKVVEIDREYNVAKVIVSDKHTKDGRVIKNVPMHLTTGLSEAGPELGDEVYVTFLGGNPNSPRITALIDEKYVERREVELKHTDQGALTGEAINDPPSLKNFLPEPIQPLFFWMGD